LRALVRDAKTGRVLISPPEDELWLLREKSGWGRASRNDYEVQGEVGPVFFEAMDKSRKWHFGFEEFYDVYIWDSSPGRSFFILQRKIEEVLTRAMRVKELKDMFSTAAPILKTLTKDPSTERVRSSFEPVIRIYVGNLPWEVDNSRLEQVFSEHGKVVSARVVYDRETSRSRGFGFVTMSDETEMNDAIAALDGQV